MDYTNLSKNELIIALNNLKKEFNNLNDSYNSEITERKKSEKEIIKSKHFLQLFIESVPTSIAMFDRQMSFLAYSKRFLIDYDLEDRDLTGSCQYDIFPEIPERWKEIHRRCIAGAIEKCEEDTFLRSSGKTDWVRWEIHPWYECEDKIGGIILFSEVITDRKQAEILFKEKSDEFESQNEEYQQLNEELYQTNTELQIAKEKAEESEEKFRLLYSSMDQGLALHEIITDKNGNPIDYVFLDINDSYTRLLGVTREMSIGKRIKEVMPEVEQYWIDIFGKVALTGESSYYENYLETTGRYYSTYSYSPKKNQFAVLVTDITERKQAEILLKAKSDELESQNEEYLQLNEELLSAKEKAEESDRLKTAFLQNISHEIRTPLNAIMGFSSLLADNFNNKANLEKFVDIINKRSNDLLDIISDILDISKIESGQLLVSIEECNLTELFSEISLYFEEYQNRTGKQNIHFVIQAHYDRSESVILTDKVKLKQIFINLLTNAFKYTDEGFIECGCKYDDKHKIQFYVSDSGIGIPADKQEIIFERFAQLNPEANKVVSGTGLGLSIVKGLLNILHGKVQLESELKKGSTFSFTIPYGTINPTGTNDSANSEETNDGSYSNKTVLIVEDEFYNAVYLNEILSNTGIQILQATTGEEAVEIAKLHSIDIILMDIRLPNMNGYDATRKIKQQNQHIKIIAQTAYASIDERQKALDSGCINYISKPIKKDDLLSILHKHLTKE